MKACRCRAQLCSTRQLGLSTRCILRPGPWCKALAESCREAEGGRGTKEGSSFVQGPGFLRHFRPCWLVKRVSGARSSREARAKKKNAAAETPASLGTRPGPGLREQAQAGGEASRALVGHRRTSVRCPPHTAQRGASSTPKLPDGAPMPSARTHISQSSEHILHMD